MREDGQLSLTAPSCIQLTCKRGAGALEIVMDCWQVLLLPHASTAAHVRVATEALVTVLSVSTLTELQVSLANGASKFQVSPATTVRLGGQTMLGGVVSRRVTVCTQLALLPQASVAVQVRAITLAPPQMMVVTSL